MAAPGLSCQGFFLRMLDRQTVRSGCVSIKLIDSTALHLRIKGRNTL